MTTTTKEDAARTPREILRDRRCTDEELLSVSPEELADYVVSHITPLTSNDAMTAALKRCREAAARRAAH